MGASAVLVGDIGSGNVAKLANQIVVALNIAAMSEALVLATKAGVDAEKVYQAIRGGLAGSTVLDAKAPMVLARNFKPGFRIELHIKDLANALSAAHAVGAPIPLTSQIMEIMQALKVEGREKEDHCSVVHFYEKLANVEVKKKSWPVRHAAAVTAAAAATRVTASRGAAVGGAGKPCSEESAIWHD